MTIVTICMAAAVLLMPAIAVRSLLGRPITPVVGFYVAVTLLQFIANYGPPGSGPAAAPTWLAYDVLGSGIVFLAAATARFLHWCFAGVLDDVIAMRRERG